jgi:RNA recognition motif-containing protein
MNLYVGNLAYTVTESDLRTAFEAFGTVDRASVITDRDSGRSKGFGFVEMPNNSEADAAIKALNDTALNGRNIKVNEARPRENRPQRGGGGGGGRY